MAFEGARRIKPETAEVTSIMVFTLDPYSVHPIIPEEFRQIGREYFARAPDSELWVWFGDLSDATCDACGRIENPQVVGAGGFLKVRSTRHQMCATSYCGTIIGLFSLSGSLELRD